MTSSAASLPECAAHVDYVRAERDGLLDLPRRWPSCASASGCSTLLCEGGPHLNAQLLAAGLVDELFLSPLTQAGGRRPRRWRAAAARRCGFSPAPSSSPRLELELLGAFESESHLFLRYRVRTRPEGEE